MLYSESRVYHVLTHLLEKDPPVLHQNGRRHEDRQALCEWAGPVGLPEPQHIGHAGELPLERDEEPAEGEEVSQSLQGLHVGMKRRVKHLCGSEKGWSQTAMMILILVIKIRILG